MRTLAAFRDIREKSSLGKIYQTAGLITAADIAQHAQSGDAFAMEVWDETCRLLGLACINVCHFIDPQMIVLAGGMSKAGSFLIQGVNRHFRANWWKMTKPTAKICLAVLGNDAGVIGAAGVAKEAYERDVLPKIGR